MYYQISTHRATEYISVVVPHRDFGGPKRFPPITTTQSGQAAMQVSRTLAQISGTGVKK
jgi:hypothetical protein